jgi:AAA domain
VVEAVTPGFVVELFGLPGSGKSHFARELLRGSAEIEMPVNLPGAGVGPAVPSLPRMARKLGLVAGQMLQRPVPSCIAMRSIVSAQRPRTEGLSRCVQWAVTQRLLTSAGRRPGVHLFDEGLLQALWSVALRGDVTPTLRVLERRSGRSAMPDLVVVVHASIDEIEDRLAARHSRHSRVQEHHDPIARRRELARGAELVRSLVAWWERVAPGPGRLIEIRNDPGLDPHGEAVALFGMIASRAHLASRPVAQTVIRPS